MDSDQSELRGKKQKIDGAGDVKNDSALWQRSKKAATYLGPATGFAWPCDLHTSRRTKDQQQFNWHSHFI